MELELPVVYSLSICFAHLKLCRNPTSEIKPQVFTVDNLYPSRRFLTMTQFKKSAVFTSILGSIAYSSLLTVFSFAGQSAPAAASSREVQSVAQAAGCVSVVSDAISSPGQKHRSSSNFNLRASFSRVSSPPGIIFNIKQDIRGGSDPTLLKNVTNGSTLKNGFNQVYIADPKNAGDRFTVEFYPA
jgi:hypothetical protein